MLKFVAVAAGLLVSAVALPGAAQATVLNNGSFSGGLSSWTASGDVIAGNTSGATPATNAQFGTNDLITGDLTQSFSASVGTTYQLSFVFGDFGTASNETIGYDVFDTARIDPNAYLFTSSITATPTTNVAALYNLVNYTFTADATNLTLEFYDMGPAESGTYGVLTSVAVASLPASVPEPISAALLVAGVAGIAVIRRRKAA